MAKATDKIKTFREFTHANSVNVRHSWGQAAVSQTVPQWCMCRIRDVVKTTENIMCIKIVFLQTAYEYFHYFYTVFCFMLRV
jgi:hypothetical protein